MFEVECPSCKASYQVDERRVPATGLKMRCPKCGESFQVEAQKRAAGPVLGAALGLGSSRKSDQQKSTMLGMAPHPGPPGLPFAAELPVPAKPPPAGPPRPLPPRGLKQTMIGVAPAQAPVPSRARTDIELEAIDEVDLDGDGDELEADLPSAKNPAAWGASGIADSRSSRPAHAVEIDLPSMDDGDEGGEEADWGQAELPDIPEAIGLPAPRAGAPRAALGSESEFDLPALGADLPQPRAAGRDVGDDSFDDSFDDLPDLSADLPDLDTGLPIVGGNLPQPSFNLPSVASQLPASAANLPTPAGSLPTPAGSLPTPAGSLPTPAGGDVFGSGPIDRPRTFVREQDPSAFGEVDFGAGGSGDGVASEEDEFDAFPTEAGPARDAGSPQGGGSGYGEVALDGGTGGLALGEEVERGPVIAGAAPAASAAVELPRGAPVIQIAVPRAAVSNTTKGIVAFVLVLAVAGGALAVLPNVGPYGAYWILDTVQAGSHEAALNQDIQGAETRLSKDTAKEVEAAFREVARGRSDAPRFRPRAAFTAYLGMLRRIRFGEEGSVVAEAKVLLEGLREVDASEVPHLELARYAEQVAQGHAAEVVKLGLGLANRGTEYAVVVGEGALQLKQAKLAQQAFTVVAQAPGARGHFGLARVAQLLGQRDVALTEIDKVLAQSPEHAGALLLRVEMNLRQREQDAELVTLLTALVAPTSGLSSNERVQAFTTLGDLHLVRSRIKQAEAAYNEALKLSAGDARAQRGLADTLFSSGRYGEALARYEAASKSDPEDLEAILGVVQSKLRLEGLEDAAKILEGLEARYPQSTAVAYWVGRAKEAIGERPLAQKAFEHAIELGEDRPELVMSFVALTRLLSQAGKLAEADAVIALAERRFPKNPEVYRALGELSSGRGAYDDAIAQFEKALALDAENIGLHFSRGVALRQARRFDEAAVEFDSVEKVEKDFPGLALERGNLFEASGRSEEALKAYESALAQAPRDPDLMLRVGCGKASAGQTADAKKLLSVVLGERPNSAEVNFCFGLALLKESKELPEARRFLERAVGLDSTRAQYHLYVGTAAIELHDYGLAQKSLDRALELDRTLADAYWQRGVLRVRQGAVKDAQTDLRRALELNPSRFEAHAALAESYMQINKEQDALLEWKAAVASGEGDAFWYYRYGKLLLDNRKPEEARVELQQAVDRGKKVAPAPLWLWEAHRILALSMGRTKEAIPYWEAFIEHGKGSPYLREALRELNAIMP